MSKSMVEKYEQMLAQDPSSTVFVELARAYIDRGDNEKAIAVCQQGCTHHASSIVGRVLWGKALIGAGRAAEAMRQFDQATSIEKENPHAYNLISEVLLRKGLYRSALPLLRKAAQLQPNDQRIAQWLEQTKAALAGGPAPVLYDATTVDTSAAPQANEAIAPPLMTPAPATSAPAAAAPPPTAPAPTAPAAGRPLASPFELDVPSQPNLRAPATSEFDAEAPTMVGAPLNGAGPTSDKKDVFDSFGAGKDDDDAEKTVVGNVLSLAGPEVIPTSELPLISGIALETEPSGSQPAIPSTVPMAGPGTMAAAVGVPMAGPGTMAPGHPGVPLAGPGTMAPGHPGVPIAGPGTMAPRSPSQDDVPLPPVIVSQTGSNAALEPPDPFAVVPSRNHYMRNLEGAIAEQKNKVPAPKMSAPVLTPSNEMPAPTVPDTAAAAQSAASSLGLDDVVSATTEVVSAELQVPRTTAPLPASPATSGAGGLLDDIPEHVEEPLSSMTMVRMAVSEKAAEAIGKEYERELAEKAAQAAQKKTFLQKHGARIALGFVLLSAVGGLVGSYFYTRNMTGTTLAGAIADGITFINADTKESLNEATHALDEAIQLDDDSVDAWAAKAVAHALLFAEHEGGDVQKADALKALGKLKNAPAFADTIALVEYLTADAASRVGKRQSLLSLKTEDPAINTTAGALLLEDKNYDEALKRLRSVINFASSGRPRLTRQPRAYVLSGQYYLAFEDYENALNVFSKAEALSKYHPERVLGMSTARLELGKELPEALNDLTRLPKYAEIPTAMKSKYAQLLGRAQSANGQYEAGVKTLTQALSEFPSDAFETQLALGTALRQAGSLDKARQAFEDALKLQPKNEDAKERFGRVLISQGREKELLERTKGDSDIQRIALLRGIAFMRLGDVRSARASFAKTQQKNGNFPAEAAVHLTIADALEDNGDKAVSMLEGLISKTKRHKGTVQIALAKILLGRNQLDRARTLLEEASKDQFDFEANAMLGDLLLSSGVPAEIAIEPLQRAADRNKSLENTRHQLVRAQLAAGHDEAARKEAESFTTDLPSSEIAWKDLAFVSWQTGHPKDAEAAIGHLVKTLSSDVEALRLKSQIAYALGNGQVGFDALNQAAGLDKKNPDTFCDIGHVFVRQGAIEEGLGAYKKAGSDDPKSYCANVGVYHANPGLKVPKTNPGDILRPLIKSAASGWDRAFGQATLARVLMEERDMKGAVASADEAVQSSAASPFAWFAVGEIARRQKNDARALEAYGKTVELDASWVTARIDYADTLAKGGAAQLPQALEQYEKALTMSQNEGEQIRLKKTIAALKKQLSK